MSTVPGRSGREELFELFSLMREGSAEAFDRFYGQAAPFVMGIAGKLLGGDRMEMEDVCHDVLLTVITQPEKYSPERGSVEAWLAVLTKSRCMDRLRKRRRIVLEPRETPFEQRLAWAGEAAALPEQRVLAKMEGEALRQALAELDGVQRRTLAEVYYSRRTRKELAEAWQVPEGTVKSRVRYGLSHLHKAMERLGWSNGSKGES
ncbi:RNA polymerase sigma factor [Cohnella cellulosilytica]|uniref:RNA polymerase sigma factor n=1 Tax=Cohnella cellulosilytica TaxID=986710 RepID=A0ABW2F1K3_9BACL